jgi:metallo-beta-lactamase family protein
MAINVTGVYLDHPEDHDLDMRRLSDSGDDPLQPTQFQIARTVEQSKALNDLNGPVIIISASGMATGGRILHHLKRWLPDKRTTVLLVGYQAAGTRGRTLQDGAREVRIHGRDITRRANIETIRGLSAHADRNDLLRWLQGFDNQPDRVYLVHGEDRAASALAATLRDMQPWQIEVAGDGQTVSL